VRQQVLDALAVVGCADAQPGKRVAVVAAFERQEGAASLVARLPQHLQPPRRQTGLLTFRHRLSAKADKPKEES